MTSDNRTETELLARPWEREQFPVSLSYRFKGSPTVWTMYFRTEAARDQYRNAFSWFTTVIE